MKLNLGCGFRKIEGAVNVDASGACEPDLVCDLVSETWPWRDSSIQDVTFSYSLEQMAETRRELKHVFTELYRVCAPDAKIAITCLHPRHDRFALNPLCTQPISPDFLQLMSLQHNMQQIANGSLDSNLALEWGVNFSMTRHKFLLSPEWAEELSKDPNAEKNLRERMRYSANVCHSIEIDLVAIKEGLT